MGLERTCTLAAAALIGGLLAAPAAANDWDVTITVDPFTDESEIILENEGEGSLHLTVWCEPFSAITLWIKGWDDVLDSGVVDVRFPSEQNKQYTFEDETTYVTTENEELYLKLQQRDSVMMRVRKFRGGFRSGTFDLRGLSEEMSEAGCSVD